MKAIQVQYIHVPATDTKGTYLRAVAGSIGPCASTGPVRLTEARDYALNTDTQARELAQRYVKEVFKLDIEIEGFGTLPNGDYVATI